MKKTKMQKWQDDLKNCDFESPGYFLWIYVLGGCGCGNSEEIGNMSFKLLKYYGTPHEFREIKLEDSPYKNLSVEILAHWFDEKGLIEHGTSIGSSWLSEDGRELLHLLIDKDNNEI